MPERNSSKIFSHFKKASAQVDHDTWTVRRLSNDRIGMGCLLQGEDGCISAMFLRHRIRRREGAESFGRRPAKAHIQPEAHVRTRPIPGGIPSCPVRKDGRIASAVRIRRTGLSVPSSHGPRDRSGRVRNRRWQSSPQTSKTGSVGECRRPWPIHQSQNTTGIPVVAAFSKTGRIFSTILRFSSSTIPSRNAKTIRSASAACSAGRSSSSQ